LVLLAESRFWLAPTWIVTVAPAPAAPNSAIPLNVELSRIRTSSAVSCATSAVIFA
jgi:hypothetical protein